MAPPNYRTATQTRRGIRGGIQEHDDFEGLPVRQWRQEWVNAAVPPQTESTQKDDLWDEEFPYGLPKEFHLLQPHTQELLKAARSAKFQCKRPLDDDDEDTDRDKTDRRDPESPGDSLMLRAWKQLPRNNETPSPSHLAKRHKNTITLAPKLAPVVGATITRVTVRRIDAAGNPYEQTVTLAEGQQVDGEIIATTVIPVPVAQESEVVQQATPARRRPPPPKRKPKGPGRGRKKKLPLPLPANPSQPGAAADGLPSVKPEALGVGGVKAEENDDSTVNDSEMADHSAMPSEDEEGDEGEEGEEEGAGDESVERTTGPEGDNREDDSTGTPNADSGHVQDLDQPMAMEVDDSEGSEVIRPSSIEEPDESRSRRHTSDEEVTIPRARFQAPGSINLVPPLVPMHLATSPRMEGSPLKNVMIQSPTEPSPIISPNGTTSAPSNYLDARVTAPMEVDSVDDVGSVGPAVAVEGDKADEAPIVQSVEKEETGTAPVPGGVGAESQRADSGPSEEGTPAPSSIKAEKTGPSQEAITPPVAEPVDSSTPAVSQPAEQPVPEPQAETKEDIKTEEEAPAALPKAATPAAAEKEPTPTSASVPDIALQPPASPVLLPAKVPETDDVGLNLLGSLEKELDRLESQSATSAGEDTAAAKAATPVTPAIEAPATDTAPQAQGTRDHTPAATTAEATAVATPATTNPGIEAEEGAMEGVIVEVPTIVEEASALAEPVAEVGGPSESADAPVEAGETAPAEPPAASPAVETEAAKGDDGDISMTDAPAPEPAEAATVSEKTETPAPAPV